MCNAHWIFIVTCWDSGWWTSSATKAKLCTPGCAPLGATAPSPCTWQDRERLWPARAYACTLRFGNWTIFAASCRRSTFTYANAAPDAVGLAARLPKRPRWSRNQPLLGRREPHEEDRHADGGRSGEDPGR